MLKWEYFFENPMFYLLQDDYMSGCLYTQKSVTSISHHMASLRYPAKQILIYQSLVLYLYKGTKHIFPYIPIYDRLD